MLQLRHVIWLVQFNRQQSDARSSAGGGLEVSCQGCRSGADSQCLGIFQVPETFVKCQKSVIREPRTSSAVSLCKFQLLSFVLKSAHDL